MEISSSQFLANKSCEQLMTVTAIPESNQFSHNFAKGVLQVRDGVQQPLSLVFSVYGNDRQNFCLQVLL